MLFFELNKFFAFFLKNLFNSRFFLIVGGGDTALPVRRRRRSGLGYS